MYGVGEVWQAMEHIRETLMRIAGRILGSLPEEQVPVEAWGFVAGPGVAANTRALRFSDGILFVAVPDASWQAQMREMAPQFLALLNRFTPQPVSRLEFVVTRGVLKKP
jgi:predicted nucleic acid-binding Zn ribbon protein